MHSRIRTKWVGMTLALTIITVPLNAAANIWQATFGQQWFYEVRAAGGENLAGTWWESSLEPGKTYDISFQVTGLRGRIGLFAGGNDPITVDRPGPYAFQFAIPEDGSKRRMMFMSLSEDVAAGVRKISVTPARINDGGGSRAAGGAAETDAHQIPKGHYVSFARERNLKTEMMDIVNDRDRGAGNYALQVAQRLESAVTTPGVKGFWIAIDWRTLETADGVYDWRVIDDNMAVARHLGLKFIVKISDRSFDGSNLMPRYFPSEYVLWTNVGHMPGYVSKRWDPWVYNRMIRLYRNIANRYRNDAAFGGIALPESAVGTSHGGYNVDAYRTALTQIITQTQSALTRGKLFWYLNFVRGGDNSDMNRDARVALVRNLPHSSLVIGAPDLTPDVPGMVGSVNSYRVHLRNTMPAVEQFCHLQHVDQGLRMTNVKSNENRKKYFDLVAAQRQREQQPWFSGEPAVFAFDDLREPGGSKVDLHPQWVTGKLWTPLELFQYGRRNFDCDYVFWHHREYVSDQEFQWNDVREVILNNQYFFE